MSDLNRYFDSVLVPLVETLQDMEPVVYDDHPNFFTDLGWDVCEGDGRIIECATDILTQHIESLPPLLVNWLWWQTSSGRVEDRYTRQALSVNPPDYSALMSDMDEVVPELLEAMLKSLLRAAELAYEKHQEEEPEVDETE